MPSNTRKRKAASRSTKSAHIAQMSQSDLAETVQTAYDNPGETVQTQRHNSVESVQTPPNNSNNITEPTTPPSHLPATAQRALAKFPLLYNGQMLPVISPEDVQQPTNNTVELTSWALYLARPYLGGPAWDHAIDTKVCSNLCKTYRALN